MPLQLAAISAMSEKTDKYLEQTRETYYNRAVFLQKELKNKLDWEVDLPKATMFIWAKIPEKFKDISSFDFCDQLIKETGVALSPGSSFGSKGDGFVRFSLIHDDKRTIEAIDRMKIFFDKF